MRALAGARTVVLSAAVVWCCAAARAADAPSPAYPAPRHFVTEVARLSALSGGDYLDGCDVRLTGLVTLVDTNRGVTVLQDGTAAVALRFHTADPRLQAGHRVTVEGTDCLPHPPAFPDYPHHPSGWDVRNSFEAPAYRGEYYLTRMRGWVRPPVTGDYRFWIASDDASEFLLSTDGSPANARKICSVERYSWVDARQWSRFPTQRSELMPLEAGKLYYVEALQVQSRGGDHLAVAWQIPAADDPPIQVIDGSHLKPWTGGGMPADLPPNGILREYWNDFTSGHVTGLGGVQPYRSMLSLREVSLQHHGPGTWPAAEVILPSQPLPDGGNYRWVQVEGAVAFKAETDEGTWLEITDGQAPVQVRLPRLPPEMEIRPGQDAVRVRGVCEGIGGQQKQVVPGVIWSPAEQHISLIEAGAAGAEAGAETPGRSATSTNRPVRGYYKFDGVVTFHDRVFGQDLILAQLDSTVTRVDTESAALRSRLAVGNFVGLGGRLHADQSVPVIEPVFVGDLGRGAMPLPIIEPLGTSAGPREGRWSELSCVVRAVETNGLLYAAGMHGAVRLWVGDTSPDDLPCYVDARLRARGVLKMDMPDGPVVLVPSRRFVSVERDPPQDPFERPAAAIANLHAGKANLAWAHRAKVTGEVTYRDADGFFVQDDTGGIRIRTHGQASVNVGDRVDVAAFPALAGAEQVMTHPQVRRAPSGARIRSAPLDVGEGSPEGHNGRLVHVTAALLAQRTNDVGQVLELQDEQRVLVATLAADLGALPLMLPGSRLRVTGVCVDDMTSRSGERSPRARFLGAPGILLRSASDVAVLRGPPWWTWKRTVALVGTLLGISIMSFLWVHLLRRRLARQKAAQLAFSRHVLERLESERRRIASNLHDSLGQALLVVKNHAQLAIQRPPEQNEWRQRLDEISTTASLAIEEVRRITHGLRPYQLDRLGLTRALRAAVDRASGNSAIEFACRVDDVDGLFNQETEIHVYRIAQEAITNVVKHAAATEAAVVVRKRDNAVLLSVRDNGCGFDPSKPFAQSREFGYGLGGMSERVRILGGTLAIDSRLGEGTSITVEIPISDG